MKMIRLISFLVGIFIVANLFAQTPSEDIWGRYTTNVPVITTSVPFLLIAPDSRAAGMGDAGVASTPDVNSGHWNPAKYVFSDKELGVSISYTPWLRRLVPDMNIAYVSGYKQLDKENAIGASLLYFSLGSINFTDITGSTIRDFTPHEFALDFNYSRLLGENFSGAVALRYIYSNLSGGITNSGAEAHAGHSGAADVSFFYRGKEFKMGDMKSKIMWGLNISNIGNKISYTSNEQRNFIPMNFRTGIGYLMELNDYNTLLITVDINKLLVPSPPSYKLDSLGQNVLDDQGNLVIAYGKKSDISVPAALFSSWSDAAGIAEPFRKGVDSPNVLKEEFAELMWSVGMEYWYNKQFALRAGYFHEHEYKGNRKYFTIGAGLKLNVFGLDFAYLIPTAQMHPLQNTLRFTLTFDIAGLSDESKN